MDKTDLIKLPDLPAVLRGAVKRPVDTSISKVVINSQGSPVTVSEADAPIIDYLKGVAQANWDAAELLKGLVTADDETNKLKKKLRKAAMAINEEIERRIG